MHQLVEQDLALELSAWFPRIGRALHRCVTCSGGLMHSKELSRDSRIDALCLSLTLSLRSLLPLSHALSIYLFIYLSLSLSLSFCIVITLHCCTLVARLCHEGISISQIDNLRCRLPTPTYTASTDDHRFSVLAGPRSQLQCACRKNPSLEGCPFKECPSSTPARTA